MKTGWILLTMNLFILLMALRAKKMITKLIPRKSLTMNGEQTLHKSLMPPIGIKMFTVNCTRRIGRINCLWWLSWPNTLITQIHTKKDINWFHQYFFEQPVNQFKTRIFFVNMRNWIMDEKMDDMVMERNMVIANEDIAVMTDLRPVGFTSC
ncbi:MAG: hypothetical protein Ct9H300mP6_02540 [Gammaproteobacteria bacterium]|nr:MAG: hypothetical protein Ct9H300mP6_02540 [Gammaproteobacteria bacterium]